MSFSGKPNQGFNSVATIYDGLKRIIFGSKLQVAENYFLNKLHSASSILVVGGGSGEILLQIRNINANAEITFVELSERMITKTKNREAHNVKLVQSNFLTFKAETEFNAIICPYFFDTLNDESLVEAIQKCRNLLKRDGELIVTDFNEESNSLRNKLLIKVMYLFFRFTGSVNRVSLPNTQREILNAHFALHAEQSFQNNLVFSTVYRVQ